MRSITTCLWFDTEGEEAANLYTSVFPDSKITGTTRYTEAGPRPAGTVMTVSFELAGVPFVALNGGPEYRFTEATSFQVICDSQEEVDHYWDLLSARGEEGPCGWLKDRFGLSWQVVPAVLPELLSTLEPGSAQRVTTAMFGMRKLDIAALEAAGRSA